MASLLLLECDRPRIGYTKIAELVATPQKYADKEVRVRGKVANAFKLPFVATKLYSIRDDTGEINVRTQRDVPLPGSEVRVRGVLDTFAVLGDQNVGLHLREVERW